MINILPQSLVKKIAAGEVVERPASVVKELIENSLDAKSTKITIRIKEGGLKSISITDNGNGIELADIPKVFLNHATSKITTFDDLENLLSFGFRGEALSSISSVSETILYTKFHEEKDGSKVYFKNKELVIEKTALNSGTQIEVVNLFRDLPARKKFMKSERTEFSYILRVVQEIALINPDVEFILFNNDKQYLRYGSTDINKRIKDIVSDNLMNYEVLFDSTNIKINAALTSPGNLTNRGEQYIYVNSRSVNSFLIQKAIKDAYKSFLRTDIKPSFVISLNINPAFIDVNVHPRKIEVRFVDQHLIYTNVYNSIIKYFERLNTLSVPFEKPDNPEVYIKDKKVKYDYKSTAKNTKSYIPQSISFTDTLLSSSDREIDNTQYLQVSNKYIVYEDQNGIFIIDQHAASERVNYERYSNVYKNKSYSYTVPLIPLVYDFNKADYNLLLDNTGLLKDLGIDIEGTNDFRIKVKRFSTLISSSKLHDILNLILENFSEGGHIMVNDKLIASIACRSAIMFGQKLSSAEILLLIKEWKQCKVPLTCAHGRPVKVEMQFSNLLKQFGRC